MSFIDDLPDDPTPHSVARRKPSALTRFRESPTCAAITIVAFFAAALAWFLWMGNL